MTLDSFGGAVYLFVGGIEKSLDSDKQMEHLHLLLHYPFKVDGKDNRKTFPAIHKLLRRLDVCKHFDVRAQKGSTEQGKEYASAFEKENVVDGVVHREKKITDLVLFELGKPVGDSQGARSDIMTLKSDIEAGLSEFDLWQKHFSSMFYNSRGVTEIS